MTFPFTIYRVAGEKALEERAELQKQNGGFVVILGDEENLERMQESFEEEEEPSADELIRQALEIDVPKWFAERQAEFDEDQEEWADSDDDAEEDEEAEDPDEDEWPQSPEEAGGEIVSHRDILSRKFLDTVILAAIPAQENWQIPCHLKLGGWNACPASEEMAAVCKFWQERYGAQIVSTTFDVLEMQVARPPQTKEEALELAQQQYLFCNDIVEQGAGEIEYLAKSLLYSPVWYFWWD